MSTSGSSRRGSSSSWAWQGAQDSRAAQTVRVLELVSQLPAERYSSVLSSFLSIVDERAEMIPVLWSSFTGLLATWLRWEDECRDSPSTCRVEVPEEALRDGVAAYYSTSVKQLLILASEDLAVDWMTPHWLLWFAARVGRHLAPKLRRLDLDELLARMLLYPVFVRGLRGIARAMVDHYSYGGSEYAYTTALFVYWDVVAPIHESVEAAIKPIARVFRGLEEVETALSTHTRLVMARAGRRVEVRPVVARVLEEAKKGLGRLLAEMRLAGENPV